MDYYEITFTYESLIDATIIFDLLAAGLGEIGFESFVQDADRLVAYIPVNIFDTNKLDTSLAQFPLANVRLKYSSTFIEARNWNEVWEQNYFKPVRLNNECLVRALFHPEESGYRYEIIIHPKMAFGTGNHETTALMLREIISLDLEGKEVLDMGCGTAVLAIVAAKKRASRVVAVDIDEWAYNNALENCLLNNTTHIQIVLGDATQIVQQGMFDYIFANINRNILINDIPSYCKVLKPEGALFLSGFYKKDITAIETVCNRNGLFLCSLAEQNNWVAVRFENIMQKVQ